MKNREKLLYAAFFVFVPLLLFVSGLLPGKVFRASDIVSLDIPFRMFAQEMLIKYHSLPFWLPGILSGIPLIDSSNLIFFYPINFIMMSLNIPVVNTFVFDMIFHMLLSALGIYLFLKINKIKDEASIIGALIFMCSGIFVSYIEAGHMGNIKAAAFIPWIFYFFHKGFEEKKTLWYISDGFFLAMQVLVIGTQIMTYTLMGAAIYMTWLYFNSENSKKNILMLIWPFVIAIIATLLFSAPQIIATVKYLKYSWRWDKNYEYFTSWSFHPIESLTFIFPQFFGVTGETYWGFTRGNLNTFYMGILPFFLVPAAFIKGRMKKTSIFLGCIALLFLILSYGGFTPIFKLLYYIPVINSFRTPNRFLYIFTFFITTLSAIGLSNILEIADRNKKEITGYIKNTVFWTAGILLLLGVVIFSGIIDKVVVYLFNLTNGVIVNDRGVKYISKLIWEDYTALLIISAAYIGVLILFAEDKLKKTVVVIMAFCIIHFLDIYRIEKQFIHYIQTDSLIQNESDIVKFYKADKELGRTSVMQNGFTENANLYYGMEFLNGYHGFIQGKFKRMLEAGDFNKREVSKMMNVKYIIGENLTESKDIVKVYDKGIKVYQDLKHMPRFYVADETVNFNSDEEAYKYVVSKEFKSTQAVLTDSKAPSYPPVKAVYKTNIIEYSPSKIHIKVDSNYDGMLVYSNYYYESWKAKVNNVPEKIYNVNYLISGLPVKKGSNDVILYFDGGYIYFGIFIMIISIIIYLIWFIFDLRWKNGKKEDITG